MIGYRGFSNITVCSRVSIMSLSSPTNKKQTKKIIYCLYNNITTLELYKVSISVVFSFSDLYLEYMHGVGK